MWMYKTDKIINSGVVSSEWKLIFTPLQVRFSGRVEVNDTSSLKLFNPSPFKWWKLKMVLVRSERRRDASLLSISSRKNNESHPERCRSKQAERLLDVVWSVHDLQLPTVHGLSSVFMMKRKKTLWLKHFGLFQVRSAKQHANANRCLGFFPKPRWCVH